MLKQVVHTSQTRKSDVKATYRQINILKLYSLNPYI